MDTSSSTRQETCVLAVSWVTGLNRYRSNYSISQGSMTETVQVLSTKLLSVISESRDRDEFTDLTLAHSRGSFRVHRIVVSSQSSVFRKACTGGFKEAATSIIDLEHVPYVHLEKMVQFFYSMDYDEVLPTETEISLFQLHARMFTLADAYDICELRHVAADKYSAQCLTAWRPSDIFSSIHDVYVAAPPSAPRLRKIACTAIRKKLPALIDDKAVAKHFDQISIENPDFAKDLLRDYIDNPILEHCFTCGSQQGMETLQARCKHCKKGQTIYGSFSFA